MSDELNHASLCLGSRLSGASVKIFKHNSEYIEVHVSSSGTKGMDPERCVRCLELRSVNVLRTLFYTCNITFD